MIHNLRLGLRIDVLSRHGCKQLPLILSTLAAYDIRASIFFAQGPDSWPMPRSWRRKLGIQPSAFAAAEALIIKQCAKQGHEIGLLCYDYQRSFTQAEQLSATQWQALLKQGLDSLTNMAEQNIECSAQAGYRCTEASLMAKEHFDFRYNSDCFGNGVFVPGLGMAPQIPVSLSDSRYHGERWQRMRIHNSAYQVMALCVDTLDHLQLAQMQWYIQTLIRTYCQVGPLSLCLDRPYEQWPVDEIKQLKLNEASEWQAHQSSSVKLAQWQNEGALHK